MISKLSVVMALITLGCAQVETPATAKDEPTRTPAPAFHYDAASGTCIDATGKQGLNPVTAATLFPGAADLNRNYPDGNAECGDFKDFNFNLYIGFGYPKLTNWDLAGADLSGAKFSFANLVDADLRGAKLDKLTYGYTHISGKIDAFTTYKSSCKVNAGKLSCTQ